MEQLTKNQAVATSQESFLYQYDPHRHLHSFPTRRSSDLALLSLMTLPAMLLVAVGGPATAAPRSEEHTSELQSRRDLVCRLLLEKKNSLKTKLSLLPKKMFRIRMSRNFGMTMITMTNLST